MLALEELHLKFPLFWRGLTDQGLRLQGKKMNIQLTSHPTGGLIGPKGIAKDLEKGQGLRGGKDVWGGVSNKEGAHGYLEQGLCPRLVQEKNKKAANPHRKGLHDDPEGRGVVFGALSSCSNYLSTILSAPMCMHV